MARADVAKKKVKSNVLMRIGLFVKQVIDELRKVVTATGRELVGWTIAVFIFVLLLMVFVTLMDFGLGKLVLWTFGG